MSVWQVSQIFNRAQSICYLLHHQRSGQTQRLVHFTWLLSKLRAFHSAVGKSLSCWLMTFRESLRAVGSVPMAQEFSPHHASWQFYHKTTKWLFLPMNLLMVI